MKKEDFKRCKVCDDKFFQNKPKQVVCSWQCAIKHANEKTKKEVLKHARSEKKKLKEKYNLETKTDWLNKLQKYFNKYIRIRDHLRGCISCDASLEGKKYDAGHFWDKSNYSGLRFHESNCFGQCVHCNKHRSGGNAHEYRIKITQRITPDQLRWLDDNRNIPLNLTIDQIKEKIEVYKIKIKEIQKKN